jgi:hypothetical protein
MSLLKIKEYPGLKRDRNSNGVINTNKTEYEEYKIIKARISAREKQGDEIRNAVKEINTLKTELREIKNLLQEVIKK